MLRRVIDFMAAAALLVFMTGIAQAETQFDEIKRGNPSPVSNNPASLQKQFQGVITESLSRQRIPFRQFRWLSPKFVRRNILELPFSVVVGSKRIVLPVYLIDHQYLVTTPLLDITRHYAVVHGTASDKLDLTGSELDISDNPALLQKQFQRVITESMSRQRIPFRQFRWLSPKFVRRNILTLPFSVVVGSKRIGLPVYLIDHQYLVTTPLLDITRHYAVVPNSAQFETLSTTMSSSPSQKVSKSENSAKYIRGLQERFELVGEYPSSAKVRGITGRTLVTFTIMKDGTLGKVTLTQSSGSRILDDESLRIVRVAKPYMPLPDSFQKRSITFLWAFSYNNGEFHATIPSRSDFAQNSNTPTSGSPPSSVPPVEVQANSSQTTPSEKASSPPPSLDLSRIEQLIEAQNKEIQSLEARTESRPSNPSVLRVDSPVDHPSFHLPLSRNSYALVIGVEHYPGSIPHSEFSDHDAQAVFQNMRALGIPLDHIKRLSDDTATKSRIDGALHWLARNVRSDSTVWVYFSGHGAPGRKGTAYLVPFDGDPTDLSDTGVRIETLYKRLNALKARHIIVALDSCFSGQGSRSVIGAGVRPLVLKVREGAFPSSGKLIAFSAAKADEEAGVLKDQGHGLFTYYFLKGLDQGAVRHGHVTIAGLYRYLDRRVTDKANLDNRSQTPEIEPQVLGPDALVRLR